MSIRLRLAVVFTAAAALLFVLGSWLFVAELSASLLGSIDTQLASQLSRAGRYYPAAGAATGRPARGAGNPAPGEYVVQVIDPAGRVRGASPDAGTSPLLGPAQLRQARQHGLVLTRRDEDERERVMAGPLARHPGWAAVASVDLEAFDRTRRDVTRELLIAGVVFVAAAGLGGDRLARAALSPVERLRREVASVSARDPAPGLRVPRTRDEIAALAATMNELLGAAPGRARPAAGAVRGRQPRAAHPVRRAAR